MGIYFDNKKIMNEYKRIKSLVKISDVMKGEGYILEQSWKNQFVSKCINPEHPDNHPSLQINDDMWYAKCFACWAGYDVFNIVSQRHGWLKWRKLLDYVKRTYTSGSCEEIISSLWGQEIENFQDDIDFREIMNYIALYWSQKVPVEVLDIYILSSEIIAYSGFKWEIVNMQWYWLNKAIIEEYLIGYSQNNTELYKLLLKSYDKELIEKTQLFDSRGLPKFKNRIVLPHFKDWDVVFFTARQTEYSPMNKYDNTKYLSQSIDNKYLYNEDDIFNNICIFICEWPMDCLALKSIWYNAIALWGVEGSKRLPKYYSELESCYLVYICFDNDWWREWVWNMQSQKLDEVLRAQSVTSHRIHLPLLGRDKIDISEYLWTESKEALDRLLSF